MSRLVLALTSVLAACSAPEYFDDLIISVSPRVLNDDGTVGRVPIFTNDRMGEAGTGTVHIWSSAGSLRDGIDLVVASDGSATTSFICRFSEDPDCHDTVSLYAEWKSKWRDAVLQHRETKVTMHATDAFVSACAFNNRRMLQLLTSEPPGIELAVLDTMPEVARTALGLSTWDAKSKVGAVALLLPSAGATVNEDEAAVRATLAAIGALDNPLVQNFTSWDGEPAVHTVFDLDSPGDLKSQLEASSAALDAGATGLTGTSGVTGPFKGELVVVRHQGGVSTVVVALHAAGDFDEAARFDLEDVAGGSAVASAVDAPVDHCEIFTVEKGKKVDFMWVVDDSCSMLSSQTAVAAVGGQAVSRIFGAQLDFASAGVSTGFYPPLYDGGTGFVGSYRTWTNSLSTMLSWFAAGGPASFGTKGSGRECGFDALATFLDGDRPGTAFRTDSEVHVIFLSDTRDQSMLSTEQMMAMLAAQFPKQHVIVSGIVCPEGEMCGDEPEDGVGKYHELIRSTGGVLGSIKVFNPITVTPGLKQQQADTVNRIVGAAINGAGYPLQHRPITASVRVAASATVDLRCDNRDIPRSTVNGWDLDPQSGRIAFYGTCVPKLGGTMVVSYKSWARFGTQIHELKTPVYATSYAADAGLLDAGSPDGG